MEMFSQLSNGRLCLTNAVGGLCSLESCHIVAILRSAFANVAQLRESVKPAASLLLIRCLTSNLLVLTASQDLGNALHNQFVEISATF